MSGSPQTAIWLVIAAFVLTIPLVSFARRVGVSYPIVLVLAGLVLGFAPGLPRVQLDPNLGLVFLSAAAAVRGGDHGADRRQARERRVDHEPRHRTRHRDDRRRRRRR